ncbi:DUF5074 domain-containing protein [uncultured Alistipes sp.]|uniref:DUF5074 domain-containing protein n=1 Tax=uncultured Alistipes sp. TaxID=538949 RepID=UPI0028037720|nr:DUF5074 domain-containing protein [uncultured Alistipes sp.]
MLRKTWSLLLPVVVLTLGSCSDEKETAPAPTFELTTEITAGEPQFVVPGKSIELAYTAANVASVEAGGLGEGWSAEVDPTAGRIEIAATDDAVTRTTLKITAAGTNGESLAKEVELYCLNAFDDPQGVFVLNEGNMTTENGSLTWISPEGYVLDDAYRTVNGTELGNVAQDMAFCDGKIYIISQNGNKNPNGTTFENDGMLVVADARTLKRTAAFTNEELEDLDWPTHIAVLDERHVYIRDNRGIYRLDAGTKQLTFITGTDGAPKSRFVTMNGKVYTYLVKNTLGKILEIDPASDAAVTYSLPYTTTYFINDIKGIQAADDGRIWIMAFGFGESSIGKFDLSTRKIKQHLIGIEVSVGSNGVAFVARGNDVYYADGTTIYHLLFDDEGEDEVNGEGDPLSSDEPMIDVAALDDNAGLSYNGLGVHPVTGRVYINTIKSFALYTQNQIWGFDFAVSFENPAVKYENYTNFPAGFYFPAGN